MFTSILRIQIQALWLIAVLATGCGKNGSLNAVPDNGVILCFGDSLTRGVGTEEATSYPSVLASLSGRAVINSGKPGETSGEGVTRLTGVLEKESPALMVLCHGGNDILQRLDYNSTKANLKAMIKMARDRHIQVVLIAVPSVLSDAHPLYAEVAGETGIPIEGATLGKLMRDESMKSDQVHLNAAGYRKLAESVYHLLQKSGAL